VWRALTTLALATPALIGPCVFPLTSASTGEAEYSTPHVSAPSQSTSVAPPTSGATAYEAVAVGLAVVFGALVMAAVARILNGRPKPKDQTS
jgi:hypothetical protein